jgi:Domain of unknown function (DUF5666)
MTSNRTMYFAIGVLAAVLVSTDFSQSLAAEKPQGQAAQSAAKPIGTIKAIAGNSVTLASDAGPLFTFSVDDSVKIQRIEPGAKDLKNAEPLRLSDLQVGDRVLVLGTVSSDGHSVAATAVVVMKKADVASKQERDRQDWQRRGVGGLVTAVDGPAGTITISTQSFAGSKTVTVHTSKDTVLRRYAPDSVKFDDAKISSIDQVKPGDQLRARGARTADGNDVTAEEIVSGAFKNIPGTIVAIDSSAGAVTVIDLATKKNISLKVTPESQLRKLPPQLAQVMAMRLKGASPGPGAEAGGNAPSGGASRPAGANQAGTPGGGASGNPDDSGKARGAGGGGGGDLQQMLARVPATTLGDLQKGDAVMIVSTEGSGSTGGTVITLLAGVEPLLAASPNGGQSMILPPWSMEAPGGEGGQ